MDEFLAVLGHLKTFGERDVDFWINRMGVSVAPLKIQGGMTARQASCKLHNLLARDVVPQELVAFVNQLILELKVSAEIESLNTRLFQALKNRFPFSSDQVNQVIEEVHKELYFRKYVRRSNRLLDEAFSDTKE